MKTSELTGTSLAYAVGIAEGCRVETWHRKLVAILFPGAPRAVPWSPHSNWAQGGPIIEREKIKVSPNVRGTWSAQIRHTEPHPLVSHPVLAGWTNSAGPTPLTAAMRCYVASKLGDIVNIPKELE